MAVREIMIYPKDREVLRSTCKRVRKIDKDVMQLIHDLKETLFIHPEGIGLAAPQINRRQRVVVVRLESEEEHGKRELPIALINPEIIEAGEERKDFDGCLSFPNLYGTTTRPHHLRVTGINEQGNPFEQVFDGFDAVLVHHEIDHLDGILFIDHIERPEDLYSVGKNELGELVRLPVTIREDAGTPKL